MRLDPARREVGAGEFTTGNKLEHVRIDPCAQRFDAIPNERVAPVFIAVKKPDLQHKPQAGQRARQAPGLDHNAIIDHR
jgi:hypothetical protein